MLPDEYDDLLNNLTSRPASGFRTDRNNNPIAAAVGSGGSNQYTKALDAAGIPWEHGDVFPSKEGGASMRTIRIKGDPYEGARAILSRTNAIQGWYARSTGRNVLPKYGVKTNQDFVNLPRQQQDQVISGIYQSEGGKGLMKPPPTDDYDTLLDSIGKPSQATTQTQEPQQQPLKTPQVTSSVREVDTGEELPVEQKLSPLKFQPVTSEQVMKEGGLNPLARAAVGTAQQVASQNLQLPKNHPDLSGQRIAITFDHQPTADEVDSAFLDKLGKGYSALGQRFTNETGHRLTENAIALEKQSDGSYIAHARPTQGFVDAVNAYAQGGRSAYESSIGAQNIARGNVAKATQETLKQGEGVGEDYRRAFARHVALPSAQLVQNLGDAVRGIPPEGDKSALAIAEAQRNVPESSTKVGKYVLEPALGAAGAIHRAEAMGGGTMFPAEQALENVQYGPEAAYKAGILAAPILATGPIGETVGADALTALQRQALLRGTGAAGLTGSALASGASPKEALGAAVTGAAFPVGAKGEPDVRTQEQQAETLPISRAQTVPDFARTAESRPLPSPRETRVRDTLRNVPGALISTQPTRPPAIEQVPESLGVVGPTKPVEGVEESAKLNRWQHRDFGRVTESTNQSGVGKGSVRVLAEDGTEHIIQRPKGTGAGNQIAIPVRDESRLRDEAAQAQESALKITDKRRTESQPASEAKPVAPIQPESPSVPSVEAPTSSTPERIAFLERKLANMKSSDVTLGKTYPVRLAAINDVRTELEQLRTQAKPSEPPKAETTKEAERSYPKTLEATGRSGGADRVYQVVGDQEAIDKANARIAKDPEAARRWASDNLETGSSKEAIATGLRVADNLSSDAVKEPDPVKAAEKHTQASELYSKAAARLTEAGQTVQAASLAQKYDPSGAALEVQRIVEGVKGQGTKPELQDVEIARDLAEKYQTANQRIGELEKRITEIQQGKPARIRQPSALEPLKVRLDKAAAEAMARLEARKSVVISGSQAGASTIPLDIADYAIIGAAKIAKGGLTFADWSAEMIKDFGEEVKPHLNAIFRASKNRLDEQRAAIKEESAQRGATRELTKRGVAVTPESIESLRTEKSKLQAERRQARIDLDRHYRELERKEQNHTLDAVLSLTRDSLLSVRGVLRIAMGMGGKQVLDFGSRFVKAGTDIARSKVTGGPRTISAPSFESTLRTIGGFVQRAPSAITSAVQGKPSQVMPNVHGGPTENPYVNLTVGVMQKIYAGKEAFVSSWAYPEALEKNARVFALNDRADGLIKLGETNQRTRDYLSGKLSFEGKRNQKLAQSLANQAANYEVSAKQIIPSMKEFRAKEMTDSPSELLHSMALQATDRAVYRQPYESKLAQKLGEVGTTSLGGKIARNIVLPFSKRPANNIADNLFGYTGLRTFGEGYKAIRESINGDFGPARVKSFNDAIGKGATGFAVMAVGAALARSGKLISPLDKDKSKAGSLFINGKYYNVSNVPVIGWLLGMGAAYQKDGAANLPKALYRMVSEHPLLRSAKDISDMVEGLKSNKPAEQVSEYAGRQGARLVPAPVKIAAEASDTEERQTKFNEKNPRKQGEAIRKNLIAPVEASLPILRRRLPSTGTKGRLSVVNPLYQKPISRRPQGRMIQ